jgi:hypothetical protein
MRVFQAAPKNLATGQNAFVGRDKADTGNCSLKRLIAPGIGGRFAFHLQT